MKKVGNCVFSMLLKIFFKLNMMGGCFDDVVKVGNDFVWFNLLKIFKWKLIRNMLL